MQMTNEDSPSPVSNDKRRRNPKRTRVAGVVPQQTDFGASLPMRTPKKLGKLTRSGTAATEIEQMIQTCTGLPMKSYPLTYRRCARCTKKTAWYCAGCKRWLCLDRRDTKDNQKKLELYTHQVQGEATTF